MATNRDKVKVISFLSGQEVIGEVTNAEGTYYMLNPFLVAMQPGPQGNMSLGLIPWPILADPTVVKSTGIHVFNGALACAPYTPNDQLLTGYMERMTGLALPAKSPLILTE